MIEYKLTDEQRKLVEEWVKDLEGGKFRQGQKVLRNDYNDYCCLGVLAETWKRVEGEDLWQKVPSMADEDWHTSWALGGRCDLPTVGFLARFGLHSVYHLDGRKAAAEEGVGVYFPERLVSGHPDEETEVGYTLAELNDEGHDFHTIAGVIRWCILGERE